MISALVLTVSCHLDTYRGGCSISSANVTRRYGFVGDFWWSSIKIRRFLSWLALVLRLPIYPGVVLLLFIPTLNLTIACLADTGSPKFRPAYFC